MPPPSPVTMCARNDRTPFNSASDCRKTFRPSRTGLRPHPKHKSAKEIPSGQVRPLTTSPPRRMGRASQFNIRCWPRARCARFVPSISITRAMNRRVAGLRGVEPPTTWFVARCSIQLSYRPAETTRAFRLDYDTLPATSTAYGDPSSPGARKFTRHAARHATKSSPRCVATHKFTTHPGYGTVHRIVTPP
jgi:hypothetical protein